jgi:hypothetical protein
MDLTIGGAHRQNLCQSQAAQRSAQCGGLLLAEQRWSEHTKPAINSSMWLWSVAKLCACSWHTAALQPMVT